MDVCRGSKKGVRGFKIGVFVVFYVKDWVYWGWEFEIVFRKIYIWLRESGNVFSRNIFMIFRKVGLGYFKVILMIIENN